MGKEGFVKNKGKPLNSSWMLIKIKFEKYFPLTNTYSSVALKFTP